MESETFEKLLKREEKNQDDFHARFGSFRGKLEERLFLFGANCFSEKSLSFGDLAPFQDILTNEDMMSLILFKNKIFRNNLCLNYGNGAIINTFGYNPNTLDYSYFVNLNGQNNLYEFCQIYYSIFQKLINENLISKTGETVSAFGKLHDYRNALNHNPINRNGWLYPKGTTLKEISLTQQEAINELFAMLKLANTK
jgi:hypothetical protein